MGPFDCAAVTLPACRAVLQRLTEEDLSRPTPCTEYSVGEVGQHLVRSMVLLASVAGEQIGTPVAGSLDTTGSIDTTGSLDTTVGATAEAALAAWRHRGLDGSVAVGRSALPASLAVEIIPLELLVHGWDIAHATGHYIDVTPEVAGYVLDRARELITADKRGRSFAAELPAGAAATTLQRLVAFTGRAP